MSKNLMYAVSAAVILIITALTGNASEIIQLKHFPMDNLKGIITGSGVSIDKTISSDGQGSLKVKANQGRTVVRLFEINDITVENTQLVYQARLRTENVETNAYVEMWCGFHGRGEFFSRNPNCFLRGTNEWSTVMTYFFLQKGDKPDYIKLNLVLEGKGTAWIDDVRLFKTPLPKPSL